MDARILILCLSLACAVSAAAESDADFSGGDWTIHVLAEWSRADDDAIRAMQQQMTGYAKSTSQGTIAEDVKLKMVFRWSSSDGDAAGMMLTTATLPRDVQDVDGLTPLFTNQVEASTGVRPNVKLDRDKCRFEMEVERNTGDPGRDMHLLQFSFYGKREIVNLTCIAAPSFFQRHREAFIETADTFAFNEDARYVPGTVVNQTAPKSQAELASAKSRGDAAGMVSIPIFLVVCASVYWCLRRAVSITSSARADDVPDSPRVPDRGFVRWTILVVALVAAKVVSKSVTLWLFGL